MQAAYGVVRVSNKTADQGNGFDVAMTDTTDKSEDGSKDSDKTEKKEKTDQKSDAKKDNSVKEEDKKEETLPTLDLTKNEAKKSTRKKSSSSSASSSSSGNAGNTTTNGSNSTWKPCMRFGYDFKLPTGADFEGCEWNYGTAENALAYTLSPKDKTNHIKNPEGNDADVYRSNIVFTKLGSANYENNVYARVLVKYTLNGKSYSKMGTSIDTRTVKEVADKIIAPNSEASQKQKDYATEILRTISSK